MGFIMKGFPLNADNTPIYQVDMEDKSVMGMANNNGSIVVDKDLKPSEINCVIAHEKIHLEQMKRGDLNYDNNNVYWKGKKYPRQKMKEGAKNLPWEAEAYRRA
jgi:hypothetical protein